MQDLVQSVRQISLQKWLSIGGVVFVMILMLCIYSWRLNDYLKNDSLHRLGESSQHIALIVQNTLSEKQDQLERVALLVENSDGNTEKVRTFLQENDMAVRFNSVALVQPDGTLISIYDPQGQLQRLPYKPAEQAFFTTALQGRGVTARMNDDVIFALPLTQGVAGQGVLMALCPVSDIQQTLSVDVFGNQGYSLIVNKNGDKIASSKAAPVLPYESYNIFLNYQAMGHPELWRMRELRQALAADAAGIMPYYGTTPMYLSYQPLESDDLYLLTAMPQRVVTNRYREAMMYTYQLFIALTLVMVVVIAAIMYMERQKKRDMERLLFIDPITQKTSHEKFMVTAREWVRHGDSLALISMDINNFKLINVVAGYDRGNRLLKDIADILDRRVEGIGIFARKYGDVYSILLRYSCEADVITFCCHVIDDVQNIYAINHKSFRIEPAIGIYLIPPGEMDLESCQNCAIMARREVKRVYESYYQFYNEQMKQGSIARKQLLDEISRALKDGEFFPYYQPKYDAKTRRLLGAEALIRWQKKDGTMVSPGQFIPLAEEVGIIMDIDDYMLRAVCQQQRQWLHEGYELVPISVNVSRHRMYRGNFIYDYMETLKAYGLNGSHVQIEVTEGTLFTDAAVSEQLINTLRSLGIDVLIDDFGTGYSSISMVKQFNATSLKIDKSFIDDMSDTGKKMIRYVIEIAQLMRMKTIAEGVETKEQYEFLRDYDCDAIQGFYFSRPLSSEAFAVLLESDDPVEPRR